MDRRDFFKTAGISALAMAMGSSLSAESQELFYAIPDNNNKMDKAMTNHCATWVQGLLEDVSTTSSPEAVKLLEGCGKKCALRQNAMEYMAKLRESAAHCRTRADYVEFLRSKMPIDITEAEDGIVMRLGKKQCTCPMVGELNANGNLGALCNCTCGHEKASWSVFFGKPVDVQIVESFLRGGKDCVIKIRV